MLLTLVATLIGRVVIDSPEGQCGGFHLVRPDDPIAVLPGRDPDVEALADMAESIPEFHQSFAGGSSAMARVIGNNSPSAAFSRRDWLAELLVSAAMATDGESRVMHAMGPRRRISAMVRAMGDALRSAGRAEPVVERVDVPATGYPFMEPGGIPADWRVPPHPGDAETFAAMIQGRAQRS